MLLIEIKERWNGNVHFIITPNHVGSCLFLLLFETFSLLVEADSLFNWIWNSLENLLGIGPEHSLFHNLDTING